MDDRGPGQSEAMAVAQPTRHALHYVQGAPHNRMRAEHAPYNRVGWVLYTHARQDRVAGVIAGATGPRVGALPSP